MLTRAVYATREMVREVVDIKTTARNNRALDRALSAGADAVDACTRRRFWPEQGTRYFDWPDVQYPLPWRLWLDENELAAWPPDQIASGGTSIDLVTAFQSPSDRPPYTKIELDRASNSAFAGQTSPQRGISITGLFGYSNDEFDDTTVSGSVDSTQTTLEVAAGGELGVGSLIRVDSERMLVVDRSWVDTGQTVTIASSQTINSFTGTGFVEGETLLVDSERMRVEDVAGTTVVVKRAYDGSVLAAHTAAAVYSSRELTVARGFAGTVAASHNNGATIAVHQPPGLVSELNIGEALNILISANTGWARVIGSSEYATEYVGKGLDRLRCDVKKAVGRRARAAAV